MAETPSHNLQLMDFCAQYAVDCTIKALANDMGLACPDPVTHVIPEYFQAELRMLAFRSAKAMQNRKRVPWDLLTYSAAVGGQDGNNAEFEAALMEKFRPADLKEAITDACLLEDVDGVMLCAYLPDAMTVQRQDQIADLTQRLLGPALEAHPPKTAVPNSTKDPSRAWRSSETLFAVQDRPLIFGRGSTTLSPGWYAQGFDQGLEGLSDRLHVSSDLGPAPGKRPSQRQLAAQAWVAGNVELGFLISAALAVLHPEQYRITRDALAELSMRDHFADHVENWTFAFNVVTVIANRVTPLHRDRASGAKELFDALLSIGGGARTALVLPGLGARLQYDSGTLVFLQGSIHPHQVSPFDYERLCVACYARPAVLRALDQRHPRAPYTADTMPRGWYEMLGGGRDGGPM
ncbi:unnamed protein product [Peniophora sp. CBMAI 1063]|nr:unnamed protein product [Peniophora sp. CBMAI 1063]